MKTPRTQQELLSIIDSQDKQLTEQQKQIKILRNAVMVLERKLEKTIRTAMHTNENQRRLEETVRVISSHVKLRNT